VRTTRFADPEVPTRTTRFLVGSLILAGFVGAGAFGISTAIGNPSHGARKPAAVASARSDSPVGSPPQGGSTPGALPTQAVPRPLADIEGQTEDIIDKLATRDWAAVRGDVTAMRSDWARYSPVAAAAGVPASVVDDFQTALARLPRAVATRDLAATAQAANDASGAAVEMLARYDLGYPVQIGRLDVIGRQIVIDVDRGDFRSAERALLSARQQLSAAERSLTAQGGVQVLDQAMATLAEMQRLTVARDATGLKTQAAVLLEVVDGMEQLYR